MKLEQILAKLRAACVAVDPTVAGRWCFSPSRPGTYGYHHVDTEDGLRVASIRDKWPKGAAEFIAAASPANVFALLAEVTRLRARVDGLLDAMNSSVGERRELARELETVREAGRGLYMAGIWYLPTGGLSEARQGALWKDFRDALGLEPGTATAAGIGADPAEPPLPLEPVS